MNIFSIYFGTMGLGPTIFFWFHLILSVGGWLWFYYRFPKAAPMHLLAFFLSVSPIVLAAIRFDAAAVARLPFYVPLTLVVMNLHVVIFILAGPSIGRGKWKKNRTVGY